MTTRSALGGLVDRARGATPRVRPALGPRFVPVRPEPSVELAEPPPDRASIDATADAYPMPHMQDNVADDMNDAGTHVSHRRQERTVGASLGATADAHPTPHTLDNVRDDVNDAGTHVSRRRQEHTVRVDAVHASRHDADRIGALVVTHRPRKAEVEATRHRRNDPVRAHEPAVIPAVAQPSFVPAAVQPVRDLEHLRPSVNHQRDDRHEPPVLVRSDAEDIARPSVPPPVSKAHEAPADDWRAARATPYRGTDGQRQTAAQASSSAAAPSVQVTIGRVEVRAAPPRASAPHSQTPARPAISLHAYLQRSRGGGS